MLPSEEIEKLLLEHKLEVRRILYEKLFLGALIAIVGLFGNIALENYRNSLVEKSFFLEKKFAAINEIRQAYGSLFSTFDGLTLSDRPLPPDYDSMFRAKLDGFSEVCAKWQTILPAEFRSVTDYHTWVFCGIQGKGIDRFRNGDYGDIDQHRAFVAELMESFTVSSSKVLLAKNQEGVSPIILKPLTQLEAEKLGGNMYYDLNFNDWKMRNFSEGK